jgi:putative heme-binding domain-containing protein
VHFTFETADGWLQFQSLLKVNVGLVQMKRRNMLNVSRVLSVMGLLAIFIGVAIAGEDEPVSPLQARRDKIMIEALLRLPKEQVKHDEKTNVLVKRYLKTTTDGNSFLKVIQHCEPEGAADLLWEFALSPKATDSAIVQAIELALDRGGKELILGWVAENQTKDDALVVVSKLALVNHSEMPDLLLPIVTAVDSASAVATTAAQGLARNINGQRKLVELARAGKLRGDAKSLVAGTLRASSDKEVAQAAAELFPLPMSRDQKPLPPIEELAKRTGNREQGEKLFRGVATCANCHIVKGQGKNVGPDLSEIGSKLTREAMLVAILDPSAGISHNYESYALQTDSGDIATGLLVSQTDEEIVLKDAQGIERKFPRDEVEEFKKQEKSIMPENLHHGFDEQGLIDIVEFMLSLKKE